MPRVQLEDGRIIEFDREPSPQDVEEAVASLGGSPISPMGGGMGGLNLAGVTLNSKGGMTTRLAPQKITQQQKDIGTLDVKRQVYSKDLENFFAIDDVLQKARGKGLGRIGAGGKMTWEGFKQDSSLGRAVATHDATRKRLRVQLVRAAGDVGNINIVEQKAAEMMIPTQWDDAGTAELKRSYLQEIGRAINDKDGNAVKSTLSKFMGSQVFQSAKDKYNTLRSQGKSAAEAKKLLGL